MVAVVRFKTVNSTSTKARSLLQSKKTPFVVVAGRQTAGRGRFSRRWLSQTGGLYATFAVPISDIEKTHLYTFAAALSVRSAVVSHVSGATVKWPNDVMIDGKKICGILTEVVHGDDAVALIGVGVNVNQERFSTALTKIATSIRKESGKKVSLNSVLKQIIVNFEKRIRLIEKNPKKLLGEYKKYSSTLKKEIVVKTTTKQIRGTAQSINSKGFLVLKTAGGKKVEIVEGDIIRTRQS